MIQYKGTIYPTVEALVDAHWKKRCFINFGQNNLTLDDGRVVTVTYKGAGRVISIGTQADQNCGLYTQNPCWINKQGEDFCGIYGQQEDCTTDN